MRIAQTVGVFTLLSVFAFGGEHGKIGSKLEALKVSDLNGSAVSLPLAGKTTAVIFVSTQCPVSNAYNERMKALYADYASKGVEFVGINSNSTEAPEVVAKHAADKGFQFRVYKDQDNVLADKLNAQVTPEVYLFNKEGTLVYHGPIDNSQNEANITQKTFREALDATLDGKAIATPESKAFGCGIKRVKKAS